MSEEEARTKWCPMVRIMLGHDNQAWQGLSVTNRGVTFSGPQDCMCIGSNCMMWRSRERSHCSVTDGTSCPPAKLDPEHPCIECKWNVIEFKGEGFCGIGGKP
jgi:hypothetical protein